MMHNLVLITLNWLFKNLGRYSVATSSLGVLLTTVRAAALVAAPSPAASPLSGSYLCLYATFTVLTCMDKFMNLYALLVVVDE